MEVIKCKCGGEPIPIVSSGGGLGITCPDCGKRYTHPCYTWEQMVGVWNYANSPRNTDGE